MNYISKTTFLFFLVLLFTGSAQAIKIDKLAKKEWRELESLHFHVITDAKLEVAEKLIRDLEEFRYFISIAIKHDILKGVPPVKILAVSNSSNFKRLGLHDSWGGAFLQSLDGSFAIADIKGYETDSDESNYAKSTLMHEYVHYAMANTFTPGFYPPWYSEGIAEYLSTFQHDKDKITVGNLDAFRVSHRSRRSIKIGKLDIEELFKTKSLNVKPKTKSEKLEFHEFYDRALAVMHYFSSSEENQRKMERYVKLINAGYEVDIAFKKAFECSFAELELEIRKYTKQKYVKVNVYSAGEKGLRFPPIKINANILSRESVYRHMADFLTRLSIVSRGEKEELLLKCLKRVPGDLDLRVMLADHYFFNSPDKSKKILNEIFERHDDNYVALTISGDLIYEKARLRRAAGLDGWDKMLDQARSYYRKAIQSNRFYARPYAGIGRIYTLKTDNKLLHEGAVSFDTVRFFANQRDLAYYYLSEANLRLRMGDYANALKAFRGHINLSDSNWSKGFGRFVYDALAYRELADIEVERVKDQYRYADGSVYTGDWNDDKPQGEGKLIRTNGAVFTGTWSNGLLVGKGEFISSNGYKYIGDFSDGAATGNGWLVYPDESYIKESRGNFFNAYEHGSQEFIYRSGSKRIGNYWMGMNNGREQYIKAKDGEIFYDRVFGRYKITLDDGIVFSGWLDKNDKPDGMGACYKQEDKLPYWCRYEHGVEKKQDDES